MQRQLNARLWSHRLSVCEPDVAGCCLHSHKDRWMQSKRELLYRVQYLASLTASQLIPHDQRKYVGQYFVARVCWLGKLCCLVLVWVVVRDQNCWWNPGAEQKQPVAQLGLMINTERPDRWFSEKPDRNAVSLPANVLVLGVLLFRRRHILHKQGA